MRGRVHRAAVLAGVAVLVLGAANGALALDVPVGEEHAFHRIEELLYLLRIDQLRGLQLAVDVLRELGIFFRVGRMPVVELDVKAVEVLFAPLGDSGDEFLGRLSRLFRREHDRGAVRVVRADEGHAVALHALEPHPDVGLDVFHDVADMEGAVRVRKSRGDEQPAGHADFQKTVILPSRAVSGAALALTAARSPLRRSTRRRPLRRRSWSRAAPTDARRDAAPGRAISMSPKWIWSTRTPSSRPRRSGASSAGSLPANRTRAICPWSARASSRPLPPVPSPGSARSVQPRPGARAESAASSRERGQRPVDPFPAATCTRAGRSQNRPRSGS